MKKTQEEKYEAPLTKRTQVILEEGFMKASVVDKDDDNHNDDVDAGDQGISGNHDFTGNPWE